MNREACIDECLYKIDKAIRPIELTQKIRVVDMSKGTIYFEGYAMSYYGWGGEDKKFDINTLRGLKHYSNNAYLSACNIPCISINLISIDPGRDYDISEDAQNEEEREVLKVIQRGINVLEKHKYIRGDN